MRLDQGCSCPGPGSIGCQCSGGFNMPRWNRSVLAERRVTEIDCNPARHLRWEHVLFNICVRFIGCISRVLLYGIIRQSLLLVADHIPVTWFDHMVWPCSAPSVCWARSRVQSNSTVSFSWLEQKRYIFVFSTFFGRISNWRSGYSFFRWGKTVKAC